MTSPADTMRTALAPAATNALDRALESRARPQRPGPLRASIIFGWRALLKIKHVPEQLFDVTMFPIMFTLMFTYLFGGALAGSTEEYLQFLLPGIIVQTVVMITMYTGMTVNGDIEKGVFDRFRSLPVWRPSFIVGALLGDMARYSMASAIIIGLGLLLDAVALGEDGSKGEIGRHGGIVPTRCGRPRFQLRPPRTRDQAPGNHDHRPRHHAAPAQRPARRSKAGSSRICRRFGKCGRVHPCFRQSGQPHSHGRGGIQPR